MSTLRERNLKTQQLLVILDLCLRKTLSAKSHDDRRDAIFFEKNVFEKLCFRDGWHAVLTEEIKLRFQVSLAWCGWCISASQLLRLNITDSLQVSLTISLYQTDLGYLDPWL